MKTPILFLIFLISLTNDSYGFEISSLKGQQVIHSDIFYWVDQGGQKGPEEVLKIELGEFKPVLNGKVNFGPLAEAVWYRVALSNDKNTPATAILTTGFFESHHKAYSYNSTTKQITPLPLQEEKSWTTAFKVTLAANSTQTLLLKIQTLEGGSHIQDFSLFEASDFWKHDTQYQVKSAFYFSALFTLAIYNLFLLFSTRDTIYLIYTSILASSFLFVGSIDAMGAAYFWERENSNVISYAGSQALGFFGVLFTQRLLSIKAHSPKLNLFLNGLAGLFAICFASSLLLPIAYIQAPVAIGGIIGPIAMLLSGIISLRKKTRISIIYLSGWFFYLTVILINTSYVFGFPVLNTSSVDNAMLLKIGSFIELIFFSFALADRINQLSSDTANAQLDLSTTTEALTKELEEKVQERTKELTLANETKDKFFSIISHDLKGPIGALSVLFNDVLKSGKAIDDVLFDRIKTSTSHTYRLLEELLNWAQVQTGEVNYSPSHFPLINSIYENLQIYENQATQKEILINFEGDASYYVYADYQMVTTVLRNLVNNAIKFTQVGGKVIISTLLEGDYIKVTVKDNGVGINKDTLAKLFRIDNKVRSEAGTQNETGTGLGLIMCEEFITRNGGTIGVESTVGQGSEFWFTIPLGNTDTEKTSWTQSAWLQRLESYKVLLVEGDILQAKASKQVFDKQGVNYKLVGSAFKALQVLQAEKFDLVITAIDMVGMNGVELAQAIKKEKNINPWVVSLSSYTKKDLTQKMGEVKFESNLSKPLNQSDLQQLLQDLLTKSPLEQA